MSSYSEQINFSILGPVSAGKSTYFNSITSSTYSDMKRRKTTMLPQIYNISKDPSMVESIDTIFNKNRSSNEHIIKIREDGTFNIDRDFKEIVHTISPIKDFINLPDHDASYSILDMPGLNDAGDTLYYDYIKSNSHNIDVYLLVFDINSGLNTTDEVNIINLVVEQIKKNNHGYIHILINKCDELDRSEDGIYTFGDGELNELYERCVQTANRLCIDIKDKVSISPLCSSKLYVYKAAKNDINNIDESMIDTIIKLEFGIRQLKKLDTLERKRAFIAKLIDTESYNDWLKTTGYDVFLTKCNIILQNYTSIINYHIFKELSDIYNKLLSDNIKFNNATSLSDFIDNLTNKLLIINRRFDKLKSIDDKYVISDINLKLIKSISNILESHINSGIDSYSGSSLNLVELFIGKVADYSLKFMNLFSNPLESSKNILDGKRIKLLTEEFKKRFSYDVFLELFEKGNMDLNIFGVSIENTLTNSNFKAILQNVSVHVAHQHFAVSTVGRKSQNVKDTLNISNNYIDNVVKQYIKISKGGLYDKQKTDIFLDSLDFMLTINNIDIEILSQYILSYLKFDVKRRPNQIKLCRFWFNLNFSNLKMKSSKVQLLYMYIHNEVIYSIPDKETLPELEEYEKCMIIMNHIYDIVLKHYDLKPENIPTINEIVSKDDSCVISQEFNIITTETNKLNSENKIAINMDFNDSDSDSDTIYVANIKI